MISKSKMHSFNDGMNLDKNNEIQISSHSLLKEII